MIKYYIEWVLEMDEEDKCKSVVQKQNTKAIVSDKTKKYIGKSKKKINIT